MGIEDAMKRDDVYDLRVTHSDRWMYWDAGTAEWVVLVRPYRARENRTLYSGPDLQAALAALIAD
jgi:hypothetical protein